LQCLRPFHLGALHEGSIVDQARAMDISYIPMPKGVVSLASVIDFFTRRFLAWRVSITMDTSLCAKALEEASEKHQNRDIFNLGQGS
jgi:putative transposase